MAYNKYLNTFTSSTLVVQIVLTAAIVGGVITLERFLSRDFFSTSTDSTKNATLLLDFGNEKRMFEGEVIEKMTILDVLNAAMVVGKINLIYSVDKTNNTKVTEINSHTLASGNRFTFYVNAGEVYMADINKFFVKPGDKITIKLE